MLEVFVAALFACTPAEDRSVRGPEPPILEPGQTVTGAITPDTVEVTTDRLQADHPDAPARGVTYRLRVEEAGTYFVDLRSVTLDAYLVLWDAEGKVIAEDDDGLYGSQSRLAGLELGPGRTYLLSACALHGDTGSFDLLLERGDPSPMSETAKRRVAVRDLLLGIRKLEEDKGEDHPDIASCLERLAQEYVHQGVISRARPLRERALRIREEKLGEEDPQTATSLNNLAVQLSLEGRYDEAVPLYARVVALREKVLGPKHLLTATCQGNLAAVLAELGREDEALDLGEKVLATRTTVLGPDHESTLTASRRLAELLVRMGRYDQASARYWSLIEKREHQLGPEHPEVALLLDRLGDTLREGGRYEEAIPVHERSLRIHRGRPDLEEDLARGLNNLALLHLARRDHQRALPLLEEALRIWESRLGATSGVVAMAHNNIGRCLEGEGKLEEAVMHGRLALEVSERTAGKKHPATAAILNNLARLDWRRGDLGLARADAERALGIQRSALGPGHPSTAITLVRLAEILASQGSMAEATGLCREAVDILEETLGAGHPTTAEALNDLALLEADAGRLAEALACSRRALAATNDQLDRVLDSFIESQRLLYAATAKEALEIHLGLLGTQAIEESYARILSWKGRVFRSLVASRGTGAGGIDGEEQELLSRLQSSQRRLSNEIYRTDPVPGSGRSGLIRTLEAERSSIEERLHRFRAGKEGEPGDRGTAFSIEALAATLPPGSVAVDFFSHRSYAPSTSRDEGRRGQWLPPHMTAWVVHAGEDSALRVDLGSVAGIEDALRAFREELLVTRGVSQEAESGESVRTSPCNDRLRTLVWDPLSALVGDAELVFLSPDGCLGGLPFEVLQCPDGAHLIETHAFVYCQDMSSLPLPETRREEPASLLVVGGVDYRNRDAKDVAGATADLRGSYQQSWRPLSATQKEAEAILDIHDEAFGETAPRELLSRSSASEARLKRELGRYRFAHLATHGYFQPEGLPSMWGSASLREPDRGNPSVGEAERIVTGLLPGLLSGLVLSGANLPPEAGSENGLLTAEEVGTLPLACELVVLSACDTGLGRPEAGEGMLGLRRSFRRAGVRTVISSLWAVEDEATSRLMMSFYENLWLKKMGKLQALRTADRCPAAQPGPAWSLSAENVGSVRPGRRLEMMMITKDRRRRIMRPRRAMLLLLVVGCCGCPGVGPKKPENPRNPGQKGVTRPTQSDAIFAMDVEVAGLWNSIEQTAAQQGGGPAPIQTGN